jgi:TolB-like protein/Flp pilus assembly protein TadD
MVYHCNGVTVDCQRFELRRGGEVCHVEPQVFGLIEFLIENRNRVVSKDELIDAVWKGRIVSDSTLNSRISAARRALGDDGRSQTVIQTLPRRGFRLVADVSRVDAAQQPGAGRAARHGEHSGPFVFVLPFRFLNDTAEHGYLADAVTEDVIDALSRFRGLFVISPTTSIAYKGQSVLVRQVGLELDADYVVEGSLRLAPDRVVVTAELTEVGDGKVIWAEQFRRDLDDLFDVLDDIAQQVAAAIEPELADSEERKASVLPAEDMTVWANYHRGVAELYAFTIDDLARAEAHFNACIAAAPDLAQAHARLAYVHIQRFWYGDHAQRGDCVAAAIAAAQRAIAIDSREALGHFALGRALALRGAKEDAVAALERAVGLNPSFAQAYFGLGQALFYANRPREGLPHLDTAIRLSPRDAHLWTFYHVKGLSLFELDRLDDAAQQARSATRSPHASYWAYATLAAVLGAGGRLLEAAIAARELLRLKPDYTAAFARADFAGFKEGPFIDRYVLGLRSAGLD